MRRLPVVDASACQPCGGACCKASPGLTAPEDWPDLGALEAGLLRGTWALRIWYGDPWSKLFARRVQRGHAPVTEVDRVLIPLPRGAGPMVHDGHKPGACVLLTDRGCSLPYKPRPTQCRELEPRHEDDGCQLSRPFWDKDMAALWRPYTHKLEAMLARVEALYRQLYEPPSVVVRLPLRAGQ